VSFNSTSSPLPGKKITFNNPSSSSVLYTTLELESMGLSKKAFDYAYRGYQKLVKKGLVKNPRYLTICDLSQSSRKKRLYLVDLENREVILHTWVAHGRNSGGEFASRFSNKPSSLQSSLGFYITGNIYTGEHGLSLRIKGLEPGFNDKAYRRAVVIHGADYIGGDMQGGTRPGRSYGCPAVPRSVSGTLVNAIKEGTCLFIYHPSRNYLLKSKILNG
jgi:hypothetical protein